MTKKMSPDRRLIESQILAFVRNRYSPKTGVGASCHDHPKCNSRPTWQYPYLHGGYARYFCDKHLPPRYKDICQLPNADLHRLLDQLDEIDREEEAIPSESVWKRLVVE